jgi:hypothetical protein
VPDIFGYPTEAELRGQAPSGPVPYGYAPDVAAAVAARNNSGISTRDIYSGDQLLSHEERATPQRDNSADAQSFQSAFNDGTYYTPYGGTNRDYLGGGKFGIRGWMNQHPVGTMAAFIAAAAGGAAAMPAAGAGAGAGAAGGTAAGTAGGSAVAGNSALAAGTGTGLGTGAAGGLQASSGLGIFGSGGTAGLAGVGGGNAGALAASGAITGGAGTAGAGSGLLGSMAGNAGTFGRQTGLTGQAQGALLGDQGQGGGVAVPSMTPMNAGGMPQNQFMLMQMQRNKRAQELRQKRNRTPEEDAELEELTKSKTGLLG